jgi:hypothetical protein
MDNFWGNLQKLIFILLNITKLYYSIFLTFS